MGPAVASLDLSPWGPAGIWAMGSAAAPRVHPGVSAPIPQAAPKQDSSLAAFFSLPLAQGPVTRCLFSPKQVCPGAPRPQLKSDQMYSLMGPGQPQRWGCSRSKRGQESEIPDPTSHSTFVESLFSEFGDGRGQPRLAAAPLLYVVPCPAPLRQQSSPKPTGL